MTAPSPTAEAVDVRATLGVLRARSRDVAAAQLQGLDGRYRWADADGARMFDLQVAQRMTWSEDTPPQHCDVEVRVAPLALAQLVRNRTDPLALFTTGGIALRCHGELAAGPARERVQKLLNLLCAGWHPDAAARQAIERLSTQAGDFTACERVPGERELQAWLARGCPAIVENGCRDWALHRMAPREIAQRVGDAEVGLLLSEHGIDDARPAQYGTCGFAAYVAGLYGTGAQGAAVAGYMAANAVPAALDGTYDYPSVDARDAFNAPRWWVGPRGAGLKLHRDLVDNYLYQVKGAKRIDLYAPGESRFLYAAAVGANPLYEPSRVDPDRVDAARFPDFGRARSLRVRLAAGEMLYLPAGWWHRVVNEEVSWSLNFFAVNRMPHVLRAHAGPDSSLPESPT